MGPYQRMGPTLVQTPWLAEEVGFEPTEGFPSHDFQSCRFGRSRTPPDLPTLTYEMNTGEQGYPEPPVRLLR